MQVLQYVPTVPYKVAALTNAERSLYGGALRDEGAVALSEGLAMNKVLRSLECVNPAV